LIERKYLRFCDPSIPLHQFTKLMGEETVMAFRLMARHPRNYPRGGIEMSPKERDEVFWISMQVLELYNRALRTESIQRFLWNVNVQFQWHAFIILAHELQLRPEDKHTRDAWSKIEELFEYNPDVIVNTNTPLHNAVSRLILRAWSIRQTRLRRNNVQLPTPGFISSLQNQDGKQDAGTQPEVSYVASKTDANELIPALQATVAESTPESTSFQETLTPDMLADGNSIDWSRWDYMLQDFEFQNASFAPSQYPL